MRKSQFKAIIKANEKRRTETLQDFIKRLTKIREERELTKSMYFWHPSDHAGGRRWNEKNRNIAIDCEIKDLHVHYERDYSESCKHVYASDRLWADECSSFTCSDINKIIVGLDEIIEQRNKKKEKK